MNDAAPPWRVTATGLEVQVRLTPKGGRDAVESIEHLADGRAIVKARVRAAPENGEANVALEAALAKICGISKSRAVVTAGATSRIKTVSLTGDPDALAAALRAALKTE